MLAKISGVHHYEERMPNLTAPAQVLLTRTQTWSWLKAWGMQVARRRGAKKAIVALARRLAVVMHRMWVDGTEFRWRKEADIAAA